MKLTQAPRPLVTVRCVTIGWYNVGNFRVRPNEAFLDVTWWYWSRDYWVTRVICTVTATEILLRQDLKKEI